MRLGQTVPVRPCESGDPGPRLTAVNLALDSRLRGNERRLEQVAPARRYFAGLSTAFSRTTTSAGVA